MISRPLFIFLACSIITILMAAFLYNIFSGSNPVQTSTSTATNIPAPTSDLNPTLNSKSLPIKPSISENNGKTEIMTWIYPGEPTCGAKLEYSDGRGIDVLKPEYFTIDEKGKMTLLTEKDNGCNGYSPSNIADLKKYSKEQYATFSSSYAISMDLFLIGTINDDVNINTLVSFVVDNGLTGIEIDFEDFGGWNASIYSRYKKFITNLGNALHKNNKKLIVDGPATSNQTEENWYVWRYADFVSLPVDRLVVMTYDYQYDQGVGQPISPIFWVQNTIKWTLSRFSDRARISVGIPSYGYKGIIGTQKFSLLTYEQMKKESGFETAMRDTESFEMTWQSGDNIYFYQDSKSMSKKLQAIQNAGIISVSIWHLGGNLWFAEN